jgi:transketolase
MFAGSKHVPNLVNIVDRNFIQIDGPTETVMPLEPFADKYRAFGWHVIEVDGHNIEEIINACHEADAVTDRPTVIIAFTIPGKGVDFMEGDFHWHGKPPTHDEAKVALKELRTLKGKIESEHE